jgi:hypothetical protein
MIHLPFIRFFPKLTRFLGDELLLSLLAGLGVLFFKFGLLVTFEVRVEVDFVIDNKEDLLTDFVASWSAADSFEDEDDEDESGFDIV